MRILFLILFDIAFLLLFSTCSASTSLLFQHQNLSDGMTLVSQNTSFELGFFSPGTSTKRYLGIWYKNIPIQTVVWVANRSTPFNGTSGLLMIDETSNLVLLDKNGETVWSSNFSEKAKNPILQLEDNGNLVLKDWDSGFYLWQSFDYPTDTLLPEMKLGIDLRTGIDRNITSWKSSNDPSPGDFVWKIHRTNNPEQTFLKGSKLYYRSGPRSGYTFTGSWLQPNPMFSFEFVNNQDEIYFMYHLKSSILRLVMNQSVNQRQRYMWDEASQSWDPHNIGPEDNCYLYNPCGAYGICETNKIPNCQCLKGFEPRSSIMDGSDGCVRSKPLNCSSGDAFIRFDKLNLPETTHSWVDRSMDLEQCKEKCLQNCSCMAYTNFDFRGRGSGCSIWFNDLMDMRINPVGGQAVYIRMSALEVVEGTKGKSRVKLALVIVASIAALLGVLIVSYHVHRRRKLKGKKRDESEELDLPFFDLSMIAIATNNFSFSNKLGEGGFGPVYKGTLKDGQEIAVKRLSKCSGQGQREFKTEVVLIAKLQHRHLVKLLGCCIHEDEKILIYEYMPNKSLDAFLFDQMSGRLLDWSKRFNIINGIARGLLYLHQDSRLRIIHRDLKASNILLDKEMNPKISDFGLARAFGGEQSQVNTNRVVGTYGYMSPEYIADGLFSVKSDVFSFGVIVLEIISGKKNRGFSHPDHDLNLLGHAWTLNTEGRAMELLDECLKESQIDSEVIRCIHVALLCVQQRPEDRPTMSSVVVMLSRDFLLTEPKHPGFFMGRNPPVSDKSSKINQYHSANSVTTSLVEGR